MWASAQSSKPGAQNAKPAKPSATQKPSASSAKRGPLKLSELGDIVREAARRKRDGSDGAAPVAGVRRFGLTERDLTPGTVSDDRQPAYSPTGTFIAFVSNRSNVAGTAAGANYHIWIMGRDGSGLRQITGLTLSGPSKDDNVDQWQPTFSTDGNSIAYKSLGLFQSAGTTPVNTRAAGNLFVVQPFVNTTGVPPFEQRTFFQAGDLDRPSYGANGLSIAFGHTGNIDGDLGDTAGEYDVFSISPTGQLASLRRLTGGAADPAGAASQDRQPAFSLVNPGVLYFTSTRAGGASRIFLMNADGSNKRQISNPRDTVAVDEYPAPSITASGSSGGSFNSLTERVDFQSNRLAAADDATRDTNIYSLDVSTGDLGPPPTPTPQPTPQLVVSAYTRNVLYSYDTTRGGFPTTVSSAPDDASALGNPEGVVFGPDVNNDGYPEVLVSNRAKNRIDAYDGVTLTFLDIFAGAGAPTADASLRNPTALLYTGQPGALNGTLYVASGFGTNNANPPVTTSTNKIHRYTVAGGVATAAPAGGQQGSIFSNGADGVTNGIEGLAIRGNILYASSLLENKINSYNAGTGVFNSNFVAPALGGLSLPTGITFGPNGNLFVCSSGSDDVKEYAGPGAATPGDFVQDFVQDDADTNSSNYGLNAPEGIAFGPDGNLYVTALNLPGSNNQFNGSYILRFSGTTPNTPLPATATGFFFQNRVPGAQQAAVFAVTGPPNGFDPNTGNFGPTNDGPAGLAFFPSAPPPPTPAPTNTPVTPSVVENNTTFGPAARLETNPISAPSLVVANRLDPSQEDNAADREAAFSRSTADVQTAAQLAFASTRTRAAQPNAPIVNPNGGPDTSTGGGSDVNRSGGGPAHDIWVTATEDFTPPILVPVGAGNVKYPVVAPGIQAPFFAPRTAEEGLAPGAPVQIAVVLSEPESGLAQTGSVTAVFYNADQRSFTANTSLVNEKIRVRTNLEQKPAAIGSVGLFAYDDGPISAGGRERQSDAVRGDGLYYCEGTFTPPTQGDFYFDIQTTDLAGNAAGSFLSFDPNTFRSTYSGYDNIWGFSNRPFAKSSTTSDLFVSDYTQGQVFPTLTGDARFLFQQPVESYYLSNPAAIAQVPVGQQPRAATLSNTSLVNSVNLGAIDVWRVLCRGPVPDNVLQAYTPSPVSVITAPGDSAQTDTRSLLASATSCVIWASPYTGTVFAGPGTLADADTQNRLSNFLNNGGRLFVSGRDVVFSLSGGGRVTSSFLRDELQAGFGGEVQPPVNRNTITGVGGIFNGRFSEFPDGINNSPYNKADLNNLQMPRRSRDIGNPERGENTFLDASVNQSFLEQFGGGGGTVNTDIITPSNTNGAVVNSAYEINGNRVGQRIERNNRGANNFQSRAVFFSFGLEGVNRRYSLGRFFGDKDMAYAVDMRALVSENVRRYLKTGGISGTVINNQTNLPVPNFLLEITQGNQRYFARTDERGNYEIQGLPNTTFVKDLVFITSQNYGVRPAVDAQGQSLNQGFLNSFAGTPRLPFVEAPEILGGQNFRVIPAPLASVSGVATQSNGTFDLRSDDSVLPNVRVLIRSLRESSLFPGGGKFAQLTLTDAGGRFSFANVPSNTDLELIFNPDGRFESQGGDIPDRSGIVAFASNSAFGRRRIPDAQRPQRIFFDAADVTTGNNFVLNDGPTDTPANDPLVSNANGIYVSGGPILVPVGRTIAGKVFLNSNPLPGATVTIASSTDPAFNRAASTTTSTGDYAFFDVPSGTYVVTASFTAGDRVLSSSITVTVDTSQANDPIVPNIILRKQAVSGLVTVNGAAPGAPLTVELLDSAGAVVQTQQTNAAGAYVFSDVPAGTFAVRATRNGASVTSAPFTVSAFNPGPPATGGDVRVPTINISALRLTGVVTLNGVGTAGLQVQVLDAAGRVAGTTTSGPGGAYAFADLLSGQYTLTASAVGRNGTDIASVPVGLDASQANVTVPLFLYSVRGTVRFRGVAAAGQRVELLQNGVVVATVSTNASGVYLIDQLVASPFGTAFQVRASRTVGSLVVDQTPAVSVVVTRGVEQPLVVDVAPLDLVTQTIQGRVFLNGKPVTGAVVQLLQGRRLLLSTRSGAGGVFRFNEVPAGTLTLRAIFSGDTVDRTVTLQRGATLGTADLRLLLQSIRGVVRLNNSPLVGQVVELLQGGKVIQRVRSTRGGVYQFSNLLVRAGARAGYTVRATRLGFTAQGNVLNVTRNGGTYLGPILVLRSQSIQVTVRLNNVATTGATVELLLGTRVLKRGTSGLGGIITFADLAAGTYTVRASKGGDTTQVNVTVNARVATAANGFTVKVTVNLLLQSIQGTLLANTTPISGQAVSLIQNNRVLATATTNARGVFTFANLAAGTYTVRVVRNGLVANRTVTVTRGRNASITIVLALQSVRGVVTLDGRPVAGINVSLSRGTTPVTTAVTTTANGTFTLGGVPAGTYILTASVTVAGRTATASRTVRVVAGRDTVVPTIALTTPPPNSADETYQPGNSYQISVPYTESIAPYTTTTVARAFTVPPVSGGVENYRLFRFNPLTRQYEQLGANSPIRRGEGYFLQPQARGVSIRTPATDPTRRPTNVTEFEITLRVNRSDTSRNNGFNLIGFPFDPARVSASTWRNAIVITPQGERLTVTQARLRQLLSDELYTLDSSTDEYDVVPNNLVPFQGYYVRTFTDNLRVILRAGDTSN